MTTMTLSEYMEQNFTVIDSTSKGVTLAESIEVVGDYILDGSWMTHHINNGVHDDDAALAIATILNAVVKGELK